MANDQQIVQVTYSLAFNLPRGKVSFHAFGGNPKINRNLGAKYRLLARNEDERELRFYIENNEPLSYEELSELSRKKKSEGMYLVGDVFVIEVYDNSGSLRFTQRADTTNEWPPEAMGDRTVYAKYHR